MAKSILVHISGTRILPNIRYAQAYSNWYKLSLGQIEKNLATECPIYSKNSKLGLLSPFWGQKIYFQKILAQPCTNNNTTWAPCWVPEKTEKSSPRKIQERRVDRPYSEDPLNYGCICNKRISKLRGVAIENKKKFITTQLTITHYLEITHI